MFGNHDARLVVLVEGRGATLLQAHGFKETTQPNDFVGGRAGRHELCFGRGERNRWLHFGAPGDRSRGHEKDECADGAAGIEIGAPVAVAEAVEAVWMQGR